MSKNKIILFLIFLLAFFFRAIFTWSNPPSLNWDETAFGYNAYSLGIDGKDEFGRAFPLNYLESFGDFKPPVYAYLDVIPIKIFGLNPFAVRFPSILFGSIAVLSAYFLVKELFKKEKNEGLALLSAFILAVSPWHIMLSRAAFEANVSTAFIILGTLFFLRFINKHKYSLFLSALFFGLSVYAFNTARVVSPLIVVFLSAFFWRKLWENKKTVILSAIFGLLIILPTVPFLLSPQAALRFQEVNIFSDNSIVELSNKQIANDGGGLISKIIHNRRVLFSLEYVKHYLDNLDPHFLFIKGDGNPRFSTQQVGQLYLFDLPFLVIGILMLLKKKEGYYFIVPLIILIGIIPAATARETPHALRIESVLPYFQIIIAYGLLSSYFFLKKRRSFFLVLASIVLFFNSFYFFHGLFAHYPREYASEWQYGYEDSIRYVSIVQGDFDAISVTNKLGRPYIYYLFFSKYDPKKFRETAVVKRNAFGFVNVEGFDKYHFSDDPNSWHKGKTLYIGSFEKIPGNAKIIREFPLPDGTKNLVAYTL